MRSSVCSPACPTNAWSHFCPKNSFCHRQKPWTHWSGCVDRNHCAGQPSPPRLQWTVPQKTAPVPASDRVTQRPVYWWWLCNNVINGFSITTHYERSAALDRQWGHLGNTPTSSSWCVHVSLGAAAQLSVWIGGSSLFQRCFALCEWPTAENWGTAASLCEGGCSQPPQVLPPPVWDDVSMQIIHVDKFMLLITSTTSTRRTSPNHDSIICQQRSC